MEPTKVSWSLGYTMNMGNFESLRLDCQVADYQRDGRKVVNDLDAQGIRSVVVGGSGLFIQGLLEDLQFPGSDPEIGRAHV